MTISITFELDVCDLDESPLVNVFLELFELGFSAEELSAAYVQLGYLSRIENQSHLFMLIFKTGM